MISRYALPYTSSPNIRLRKVQIKDVDFVANLYANPDVAEAFSSDGGPFSDARLVRYLLQYQPKGTHPGYVVEAPSLAVAVGHLHVDIYNTRDLPSDRAHSGYIAFAVSPEYWGRGYMTKAIEELARVAFRNGDVLSLRAKIARRDRASEKVLLKNNFVQIEDPLLWPQRWGPFDKCYELVNSSSRYKDKYKQFLFGEGSDKENRTSLLPANSQASRHLHPTSRQAKSKARATSSTT